MKIIHVAPIKTHSSTCLSAEGPSNSVFNLMNAQSRNNIECGLISLHNNSISESLFTFNETIHDKSIVSLFSTGFYKDIQKRFGTPDFVHSHDIYSIRQLLLLRIIVNSGIKVYISPRGAFTKIALSRSKYKKLFFRIFFDYFVVRKSYGFIALNKGEAESIKQIYPNKRLIIAPNGANYSYLHFRSYSKNFRFKYRQSIVNIGFIGRFDIYIKGLDVLLNSYVAYQNQAANIKVKLTFIGEHRNKNEFCSTDFFNKISSKLVDKSMFNVKPACYGDAKWDEITKFDVLIQPSRSEGMPNTVLEAMSIGVPCIVTNQTNMSDIVHESGCGWVVSLDENDLLNVFSYLERMKKITMIKAGVNGMRYIKKNLTWNSVCRISY